MKKTFYLLLFILMIVIPLNIKAAVFMKKDEEGNFINDAEFRIRSLDGSVIFPVTKTVEKISESPSPMSVKKLAAGDILNNGQYFIEDDGELDYNKLINILGPEEKQILEDLKDYNKYNDYYDLIFNQTYSSDYLYVLSTRGLMLYGGTNTCVPEIADETQNSVACANYSVSLPVLMLLEETKAPAGLKKEKAIIEYNFRITYKFNVYNNLIETPSVEYNVSKIYKYNYDVDYSNTLGIVQKELTNVNQDELYFKSECGNYVYNLVNIAHVSTPISSTKKYSLKKMEKSDITEPICDNSIPVIIDYKDGSKLVVTSYVNNGGSTKAIKGSEVNYKVEVKNEGTGVSTNNVITSKIPEGFKYVSGSASDNGEYVESLNAVRWNIAVIEGESTKDLTYKVTVSADVDLSKTYISSATVSNDSSDEIVSNETRVTLQGDIVNPKTGDFNKIIVLFILSVIGLITYYILDRRSIKGL